MKIAIQIREQAKATDTIAENCRHQYILLQVWFAQKLHQVGDSEASPSLDVEARHIESLDKGDQAGTMSRRPVMEVHKTALLLITGPLQKSDFYIKNSSCNADACSKH